MGVGTLEIARALAEPYPVMVRTAQQPASTHPTLRLGASGNPNGGGLHATLQF